MTAAAGEVERNRDCVAEQLGNEYAVIFSAHLQMLHDHRLRSEIEEMIRSRHYLPEYSVSRALRKYAKVFESLRAAARDGRSETSGRAIAHDLSGAESLARELLAKLAMIEERLLTHHRLAKRTVDPEGPGASKRAASAG